MDARRHLPLSLLLFLSLGPPSSSCLDPFSAGAVGIGAVSTAVYAGWSKLKCRFKECCDAPWIPNNLTQFEGLY